MNPTTPKRQTASFPFLRHRPEQRPGNWTIRTVHRLITGCLIMAVLSHGGCTGTSEEVVVYSALDQDFSEPLLNAFTEETGIRVLAKYDTESTKTVGLTNALIAEAARPRCDVFWNNEILNTLRLQKRGLLAAYEPTTASDFPAQFQDPNHEWHGFAARARVLIVNTKLDSADYPTGIRDLANPEWKGRVGIAKPLFGTTATHAAVLFDQWEPDTAKEFFAAVRGNVQVMSGNKQVALAVARGQLDWGITDTDDAMIEKEKGMPVDIVYPDQPRGDEPGDGTLFIPNSLALIKDGPNPEAARKLIEFLLRPEVELQLASGPSAQIPLSKSVDTNDEGIRVETPQTISAMEASWPDAAAHWEDAATFLRDEFARGD